MHATIRAEQDAKKCTFIRSTRHLNGIQLMYLLQIIPINCECHKTFHKKTFFFTQFAGIQHMDRSFRPTAASIQLRPGPFAPFFSISCHFAAVYPLKAKCPKITLEYTEACFFEGPKIM